jgi:hypothetical protein
MRFVLALLLGGCIAGTLDANSRPAVIPKLSELPEDHAQRDAILDQSHATEGPEKQQPLSKKERRAVTAAAFAAAIIGDIFSTDHNVTLGIAVDSSVDAPKAIPREQGQGSGSGSGSGSAAETPAPIEPAGDLMPWVKLK